MRAVELKITRPNGGSVDINIRSCGRSFFPLDDLHGNHSRSAPRAHIILNVPGIDEVVRTSVQMPKDRRRAWSFSDRWWVRPFVEVNNLRLGDRLNIIRLGEREYRIDLPPKTIRFIDLFAGIGGTRLAFENAGARCMFSSEWDKYAQKTYQANFGECPAGDINKVPEAAIPHHDVLVAGFPCQPFSIAGVSKKNALGRPHGFLDETQGTLFFEIVRILRAKEPRAFLLENVRNLRNHDDGRTYEVITRNLRALGYELQARVIDGALVVPQHRERIFIVGTKPALDFTFPTVAEFRLHRRSSKLADILEDSVDPKYTLTDHLWHYLQEYAEKHRRAGNGFGFGLVGPDDVTRTLSARYYKDGSEILISQSRKNPRRLTPRECARLMGFPDSFVIPDDVSDTQAYKQFGNSVVVPVVQAIAARLVTCVLNNRLRNQTEEQLTLAEL